MQLSHVWKALWIIAGAGVAAGLLIVRVIPAIAYSQGNPAHALHWIVYGYDQVWYHGRDYINPGQESCKAAEKVYGPLQATDQSVIGLRVLASPGAVASPVVPTLLILQKSRDRCVVYGLDGGP